MLDAYCKLHELGYAHSVECWQDDKLVGGLYGVWVGRVFFGESMFSLARDASKVALVSLVKHLKTAGVGMIDIQMSSVHLSKMGAEEIERDEFQDKLKELIL